LHKEKGFYFVKLSISKFSLP